ncbi:MAG TPA: CPBP family intramembrane glutamic endopeptidase [Sphingomicrobium sp.]|nr:CPBP family intramembrane glutamic endopeptidase [Sphingomicrobium sp.]
MPFTSTLLLSPPGLIGRLYGLDAVHWPAWVGSFAITCGYIGYTARAFPLVRKSLLTVNSMKLVAVLFAIVTGTVEEVYFRKFLMDWAEQHGQAAISQAALSAIVFGAAHGIWGVFARQWRIAIGAATATAVLGFLLAIVYILAGRQVAPCIWAHMLINLAIEPWLIVAAASASSGKRLLPLS